MSNLTTIILQNNFIITLYYSFRSESKRLVPHELSLTYATDMPHLCLRREGSRSEIDGKQKAFRSEKDYNFLQFISSNIQYLVILRGKFCHSEHFCLLFMYLFMYLVLRCGLVKPLQLQMSTSRLLEQSCSPKGKSFLSTNNRRRLILISRRWLEDVGGITSRSSLNSWIRYVPIFFSFLTPLLTN